MSRQYLYGGDAVVKSLLFLYIWTMNYQLALVTQFHSPVLSSQVQFDDYNIVYPGPCADEGDKYCLSKVKNSVCSLEKNECFCRQGYVSIQDDDRIICKTLLTDLKCRMDGDCTHVVGSICHPGAAACTCPSGTVYAKQTSSCIRVLPSMGVSSMCDECEIIGGTCYKNESPNKNKSSSLDCLCPGRRANPKSSSIFPIIPGKSLLCSAILVDIGEYCNQEDLLCRSSRAVCNTSSAEDDYPVCQCPLGYVAVYQQHLRYHECVIKAQTDGEMCTLCKNSGGECYNMGGNGKADGCKCSRVYARRIDFGSSDRPCSEKLIHVTCRPYQVNICYYPHQEPPYEGLAEALSMRDAVAFISGQGPQNTKSDSEKAQDIIQCTLKPESHLTRIKFCVSLDLTHNTVLPCGLHAVKYVNGYLYSGSLEIWEKSGYPTPSRDMVFDITCKTDHGSQREEIGQAIDRTDASRNKYSVRQTNTFSLSSGSLFARTAVTLRVLDNKNRFVSSVLSKTPIKLDVLMQDSQGNFQALTVEACYVSNVTHNSLNQQSAQKSRPLLLIWKGCPVAKSGFTASFSRVRSDNSKYHVQTQLFPAFKMGRFVSVNFKCVFRLCKDPVWCSLPSPCKNIQHDYLNLRTNALENTEMQFITQSVQIEVRDSEPVGTVITTEYRSLCRNPFCLSTLQMILICSLASILIILLICLYVVVRRHQAHHTHHRHSFCPNCHKCRRQQYSRQTDNNHFQHQPTLQQQNNNSQHAFNQSNTYRHNMINNNNNNNNNNSSASSLACLDEDNLPLDTSFIYSNRKKDSYPIMELSGSYSPSLGVDNLDLHMCNIGLRSLRTPNICSTPLHHQSQYSNSPYLFFSSPANYSTLQHSSVQHCPSIHPHHAKQQPNSFFTLQRSLQPATQTSFTFSSVDTCCSQQTEKDISTPLCCSTILDENHCKTPSPLTPPPCVKGNFTPPSSSRDGNAHHQHHQQSSNQSDKEESLEL